MRKTRYLPVAVLALLPVTGCVTERKWEPLKPKVSTKVYDEWGRATDGTAEGQRYRVLGLGPRRQNDPLSRIQDPEPGAGKDASQDPQGQDPEQRRQREALLRTQFGPTVVINGDLITKRYFLGGETDEVFKNLVRDHTKELALKDVKIVKLQLGGENTQSVLGGMLGKHEVEVSMLEKFEQVPQFSPTRVDPKNQSPSEGRWPGDAQGIPKDTTNSLLLVTAKAGSLAAFEDALNLFFAYVPQVEIEVKVVEFTKTNSLAFGVGMVSTDPQNPIDSSVKNLNSDALVQEITSTFPLTAPILGGGTSITNKGVFSLGGIHDDWELNARLEALEAEGKVDVLSNPKLVVRNGGTASIVTQTDFPFPKAQISNQTVVTTDINFKPVGVSLGIRPVIAGTDAVILQVFADVSAVTGFADTDPVPTPIVSKRQATTSVHVPVGKMTIIGGLFARSEFKNEAKIPILGDIPVLGYLFRSTSTTVQETELQFFITPRIIEGSRGIPVEDR